MLQTERKLTTVMDHKKRLLGLEKTLSKLSGYEGWMIAKCRFCLKKQREDSSSGRLLHFEQPDNEEYAYKMQVQKSDARLVKVLITGRSRREEDSLEVTLIDPGSLSRGKQPARTFVPTENTQPSTTLTVTEKEIQLYLQAVNDTNPIHQGKDAIVPGFLMVNWMFEMFQDRFPDQLQMDVRFLMPLQTGEEAVFSMSSEENKKSILLKTSTRTILKADVTEI